MKYDELLSPEERVEVDAAVHDAYIRDDGSVRPLAEVDELFDRVLADAIQSHRRWAGVLLDAWRDEGRRMFLKRRWKDGRLFDLIHKGRRRTRTERRGTRVRGDDGRMRWVQESLIDWTGDQLEQAIGECSKRVEEERANIAMYRALLTLLRETGQATVKAALEARAMSFEEYLTAVDADRRAA